MANFDAGSEWRADRLVELLYEEIEDVESNGRFLYGSFSRAEINRAEAKIPRTANFPWGLRSGYHSLDIVTALANAGTAGIVAMGENPQWHWQGFPSTKEVAEAIFASQGKTAPPRGVWSIWGDHFEKEVFAVLGDRAISARRILQRAAVPGSTSLMAWVATPPSWAMFPQGADDYVDEFRQWAEENDLG